MDKDCQRLGADLSAYADNELDANAASAIEAHLEHCAGCRRELTRTAKLQKLVQANAEAAGGKQGVMRELLARANELTGAPPGQPGAGQKGRRVPRH